MGTFDFNRLALRVTQPKLGAANLHRWAIICVVKDKCYANNPETIDALKDNIREAIGEICCTQSVMCLKIGPTV